MDKQLTGSNTCSALFHDPLWSPTNFVMESFDIGPHIRKIPK